MAVQVVRLGFPVDAVHLHVVGVMIGVIAVMQLLSLLLLRGGGSSSYVDCQYQTRHLRIDALTISNTSSCSPSSLMKGEQSVDLHDGAVKGQHEASGHVGKSSQVVSEQDPEWNVDYMGGSVPEMRKEFCGTRDHQPDKPLSRVSVTIPKARFSTYRTDDIPGILVSLLCYSSRPLLTKQASDNLRRLSPSYSSQSDK